MCWDSLPQWGDQFQELELSSRLVVSVDLTGSETVVPDGSLLPEMTTLSLWVTLMRAVGTVVTLETVLLAMVT